MGCCFSEPVDLDGEVNLYHFDLHRAVGKGAFGKVCKPLTLFALRLLTLLAGQSRRTQAFQEALCPQIHREGEVYSPEGRRQCHSGTQVARGGVIPHPFFSSSS
jgi:hypothetical protein